MISDVCLEHRKGKWTYQGPCIRKNCSGAKRKAEINGMSIGARLIGAISIINGTATSP